MKTRLRFRCVHKGENTGWGEHAKIGTVKLAPIMPGNAGNVSDDDKKDIQSFYAATPAGQCEFSTINQAALDQFEVGKDYYLTVEAVA